METIYLAPPIFFAIAFVFSMLGMGGSQLVIPVLYWLGMDFKTEAIPLGMLLNIVSSSSANFSASSPVSSILESHPRCSTSALEII